MKLLKKSLRSIVMTAVMLTVLFGMSIVGEAASVKVDKVVSMHQGSSSVQVTYAAAGDTIKHIKTSSGNLIAKWSAHASSTGSSSTADSQKGTIALYAKKLGTYTLSFDVYNKAGKKRSAHKVKVIVTNDTPIKSYTVNGKDGSILSGKYTTASTVTVKVNLNPGYKLKKLEYSVNTIKNNSSNSSTNYGTDVTYKTFKNGGKVKLNAKGYYSYSSYSYESTYNASYSYSYVSWSDALIANTDVKVTYIDKHTKTEKVTWLALPYRLNTKPSR